MNAEQLATVAGAHITSARRWKRLTILPPWLSRLVRVLIEGHLEEIAAAWAGWRIVAGELVSPEGWRFTPAEIRALPFLRQQIAHAHARARLPAQGDWISGQIESLPGALARDAAPRRAAAVHDLAAYGARSP